MMRLAVNDSVCIPHGKGSGHLIWTDCPEALRQALDLNRGHAVQGEVIEAGRVVFSGALLLKRRLNRPWVPGVDCIVFLVPDVDLGRLAGEVWVEFDAITIRRWDEGSSAQRDE